MDKKWWHKSVVYQVYPRSFKDTSGNGIGDINGIIEKLDYIKELGADLIWISPLYKSPMDDNGYDISDYRQIDPLFGTMDDMERLILEGKKRGIGILMDLVVNHTSDEHPWFVESKSSKDNPKRDWYIWREPKEDGTEPNNWGSFFTRSAWELDKTTGEYYLHLFSRKQPDLNWDNQQVRQAVYEMMHFWLQKGIAGFRMDVINMIGKPHDLPDAALKGGVVGSEHWANHSKVHLYLREMYDQVLSKYDVVTVGETPFVIPMDGQKYSHPDRRELSMIFQFEHMGIDAENDYSEKHPVHLPKLKDIMAKWQEELHGNGWNSLYWNNHDQPRVVSRFGDDGKYRVVSAKMLATVLHLMYGTPYIYQGEEVGLTNTHYQSIHDYNDLSDHNKFDIMTNDLGYSEERAMKIIRPASRDNARVPMRWNANENAGFTAGTPWLELPNNYKSVNIENAVADENSVFHHYKALIELRKNSIYSDVITYGKHALVDKEDTDVYAYMRYAKDMKLLILANFTEKNVSRAYEGEAGDVIVSNYDVKSINLSEVSLRPYEVVVVEWHNV